MLEFRNIRFSWEGDWLLDGVNAVLEPGQVVWLSGENGSGKSTLLKLASAMIPHFHQGERMEGQVLLWGRPTDEHPPKTFFPELAYIPSRNLPFYFLGETLSEEIHLTEAMVGGGQALAVRRKLLDQVWPGWMDGADRRLDTLPQDQIIQHLMAMLVLQGARLFLLDEPFRSADDETLSRWDRLLKALAQEGCAVLASAHGTVPGTTHRWHLDNGRLA